MCPLGVHLAHNRAVGCHHRVPTVIKFQSLQVVDMIAAALEHAADGSSGDSQLAQANAQYAPRPCDHDRPSASVVAQLAVVVAHGADQADVQAADSIALKVITLSLYPVSGRPLHFRLVEHTIK